jgi:GT2 family glycosyltransferase
MSACLHRGIDIILSQRYNSNVYYVRSQCLGANVLSGKNQKPFQGNVDYDYIMWIDSDQVFQPDQVFKLISHNKEITAGLYFMEGGKQYAAVKEWDEEYFKQHATFKFLEPMDILPNQSLMEVAYSGMGFMLVKRGVYEKIDYPWFEPQIINIGNKIIDFASEDVSFCLKAKSNGIKIYIDPSVIVGHEKTTVLM